jgi:hypothetical protein
METRVYVLDCGWETKRDSSFDFRTLERTLGGEEKIMLEAERRGSVYSLQGFQDACNDEELSLDNSFILIRPIPEDCDLCYKGNCPHSCHSKHMNK